MRLTSMMGLAALTSAAPATASETISYSYDALGRLTGSVISGGPNSGVATGTSFDPAGNRSGYSVTGSSAARGPDPAAKPVRVAQSTVPETARNIGAAD